MFHHRFSHLFHFRPLHYGATKKLGANQLSLGWLADTRANRKAVIVFLRLLSGSNGQPLFSHQNLAQIVGSSNRQASSRHVELFCG